MSKTIFDTYDLNGLQLRNRIVMAPMTRSRADNEGHVATPLIAKYYKQRASAGLIITEGTFISPEGVGYINVPAIYSKEQVEGWKLTTKAVHEEGGTIFAQLWHTGAMSHPDLQNGNKPLAPSSFNPKQQVFTFEGFKDTVEAREMTIADIKRTVNDFKQAALNAFEAGFDGVEIHSANGYLLQQFLHKNSNHRTDEYGGSIENRARIIFEILDELKTVVDLSRVGIRFNPALHGMMGIEVDDETTELYNYVMTRLNDYPLAYIHLTEPFTDVSKVDLAIKEVAKHFRKFYKGTIITNVRYTKETANQVIASGDADLVAFGSLYIANPDLVERFKVDAPLNTPDKDTYYTPGEKGYTDYPKMAESSESI